VTIRNMENFAIELDGVTYGFSGHHLEEIADLKELDGDKRFVTDMQEAISRTMTIDVAHKYVDVMVRKKLQESGEFDDAISLIPHLKKKKGKNSSEIFFTALPSRLFSYYTDLIRERQDIVLLFPLFSVLFSVLKRIRSAEPVAVVFQHDRFADLVIGTSRKVFYANRCVAFDTSDEQISKLWETVRADIKNVEKDHRIAVGKAFFLTWIDSGNLPDWSQDGEIEVFSLEKASVSYKGATHQSSFLGALKTLSGKDSASVPAEKACYYAQKWVPYINTIMILAVLFFGGAYYYFQNMSDALGNKITGLEGKAARISMQTPVNINREKFNETLAFVKNLASSRTVPSFKQIVDDLSAAASEHMQFQIVKVDYTTANLKLELFGRIEAPFSSAHQSYQDLIQYFKQKGFLLQESRFNTDIQNSQFLLKFNRSNV